MAKLRKKKITIQSILFAAIILGAAAFAAWAVFGKKPYKHIHGAHWGGCQCAACKAAAHQHDEEEDY